MGTQYGYGPKTFQVTPGQNDMIRLAVPHRGRITQIVLLDQNGAATGEFEIYSSERAVLQFDNDLEGSLSLSSASYQPQPIGNAQIYSVTGPLNIVGGQYQNNTLQYDYINRDGTPTNPVRKLWLRMNVNQPGPFTLAMMIEPADLDS